MESEREQFSSSPPEPGGAGQEHTHDPAAGQTLPAGHEGQGAEPGTAETGSPTRRRRWRPPRSSSRRSAASTEPTGEATADEAATPTEGPVEAPPAEQEAVALQESPPDFEPATVAQITEAG